MNNSVLMVWPGNPSTLLVSQTHRVKHVRYCCHRAHHHRRCHLDILVPGEEVLSALGRFPEILQCVLRITSIGEHKTPLPHSRSSRSCRLWAALAGSRFDQSPAAAVGEVSRRYRSAAVCVASHPAPWSSPYPGLILLLTTSTSDSASDNVAAQSN